MTTECSQGYRWSECGAEGPDRPAEAAAQPPSEGKGGLNQYKGTDIWGQIRHGGLIRANATSDLHSVSVRCTTLLLVTGLWFAYLTAAVTSRFSSLSHPHRSNVTALTPV